MAERSDVVPTGIDNLFGRMVVLILKVMLVNYSAGTAWEPRRELSLTVDAS